MSRVPALRDMQAARDAFQAAERRLLESGLEGTASVWFLVDSTGVVIDTRIRESSGISEVDSTAVRLVRDFEFRPATFNGHTICAWIARPFRFRGSGTPMAQDSKRHVLHPRSRSVAWERNSEWPPSSS